MPPAGGGFLRKIIAAPSQGGKKVPPNKPSKYKCLPDQCIVGAVTSETYCQHFICVYTVNQRLVGVVTSETYSQHFICVYTVNQRLVGVVTSETCSDHIICVYTVNQRLVGVVTSETCSHHIICVYTVNQSLVGVGTSETLHARKLVYTRRLSLFTYIKLIFCHQRECYMTLGVLGTQKKYIRSARWDQGRMFHPLGRECSIHLTENVPST